LPSTSPHYSPLYSPKTTIVLHSVMNASNACSYPCNSERFSSSKYPRAPRCAYGGTLSDRDLAGERIRPTRLHRARGGLRPQLHSPAGERDEGHSDDRESLDALAAGTAFLALLCGLPVLDRLAHNRIRWRARRIATAAGPRRTVRLDRPGCVFGGLAQAVPGPRHSRSLPSRCLQPGRCRHGSSSPYRQAPRNSQTSADADLARRRRYRREGSAMFSRSPIIPP
jgi:hypothetical protein